MLFLGLLAALWGAGAPPPPSVQPRPIGVGPGYVLPAAPPAVLAGRPIGRLRCGRVSVGGSASTSSCSPAGRW